MPRPPRPPDPAPGQTEDRTRAPHPGALREPRPGGHVGAPEEKDSYARGRGEALASVSLLPVTEAIINKDYNLSFDFPQFSPGPFP